MSRTVRHLAAALAVSIVGIALCTTVVAWHEGYRAYVVRTGSMMPTFHPGDAVIDRPAEHGYDVGEPITFEIAPGSLVTHRLRSVDPRGGLHTKGDANKKADVWTISPEQVHGVVARGLPKMGYVLVFLRQKTGIAGVMTSALSLFLLWGLCFSSAAGAVPEEARKARPTRLRIPRQRSAAVASVTVPTQAISPNGAPQLVKTPVGIPSGAESQTHIPAPRDPSV